MMHTLSVTSRKSFMQDVVGSYVVYDPTGRDLLSCMEVGKVEAVYWTSDDDGDASGHPRPIMAVRPNGGNDESVVGVTVVHSVLT